MREFFSPLLGLLVLICAPALGQGQAEAPPQNPAPPSSCQPHAGQLHGLYIPALPSPAARQAHTDCLIALADAQIADPAQPYLRLHLNWHVYAILSGARDQPGWPQDGRFTQSHLTQAQAWLGALFDRSDWRQTDAYGCVRPDPRLALVWRNTPADRASLLCARLQREQPDPSDPDALSVSAPFDGSCPDANAPGNPDILLLPATLAAERTGDERALSCLLAHVMAFEPTERYLLPDQIAILLLARQHGLLLDEDWNTIRAHQGDAYLPDAEEIARTRFEALYTPSELQ